MIHHQAKTNAFTLAELLIALAILGVIATFTIPKVLQAQRDERYNSSAKETIAAVAQAWQMYKLNHGVDATTTFYDLTPYLNYTRISGSAADTVDFIYGYSALPTADCSWGTCLYMHNGGVLWFYWEPYNGTASTNAMEFYYDPDSKITDGTTNGPGKSLDLQLYFDGKISSRGTVYPGATMNYITYSPEPWYDPPWFHWDR